MEENLERNRLMYADRGLLTLKEFCDYLGIKETKGRELLKDRKNKFTVRIGWRLYANKKRVDDWIEKNTEV